MEPQFIDHVLGDYDLHGLVVALLLDRLGEPFEAHFQNALADSFIGRTIRFQIPHDDDVHDANTRVTVTLLPERTT
jgi:hypothetical protein